MKRSHNPGRKQSRTSGRRGRAGGKAPARRSSPENPSTPLSDPDDWLYDVLGGGVSAAGVRVNRDSALTYAAFYRGVAMIARDIAKVPLVVYRKVGAGREIDLEHPAYRLLRRRPNEYMTALTFKETLQCHLKMEGNAYAYIERRGDGVPEALLPLNPHHCWPVRVQGKLWYVLQFGGESPGVGGEMRKVDPSSILHLKGLGFDGLVGYSVLAKARESLGMGLAAREYGARYFSNGGRPSVLLEHPGTMGEEAQKRIKASWDRMYSGVENAHKTAILEEGMTAKLISHNAKDQQLLETRQFEIREVANWLGVPPHKLGDTNRTSYNSLEQENQSYLDDALDGDMVKWEAETWDKLLTEDEKRAETHTIEFMRQVIVRADIEKRFNAYKVGAEIGMFDIDDLLARENLNPLPGGMGKVRMVPMNMQPVASVAAKINALQGQSEEEVAFKREVVAAFLADGTTNDVIYNLTDIEDLLTAVGLPAEQGAQAPWLPVVAQSGPIVTGEVVTDQDGDVVSGTVQESPAPDATDTKDAVPDGSARADAALTLLRDTLLRMTGRLARSAERAAARGGGGFEARLADDRGEHERIIARALEPIIGLLDGCGAAPAQARAISAARRVCDAQGRLLRSIMEHAPQSQFSAAVRWSGEEWNRRIAARCAALAGRRNSAMKGDAA